MKTTKKIVRNLIVVGAIVTVLILVLSTFFFVYNKAPIISGEVIYNVDYKDELQLDIYLPTKQVYNQIPVIVYFHGGAWVMGRKEFINSNRINEAVNRLRDKGYAIVCPEYTLASAEKSPFPDCFIDAYDALNWVEKNKEQYNFDLKNIGVFGESAGAHLALMTSYAKPVDLGDSTELKVKLNYVVDIYGPVDLQSIYHMKTFEKIKSSLDKLPEGLRKHFDISQHLFGFDPEKDSARAQSVFDTYSPINYVNENAPPTLIIHGSADQIVPFEQSKKLQQKLDSFRVENELYKLEDVNHALRGITGEQKANVQNWIVEFVEKYYQPSLK